MRKRILYNSGLFCFSDVLDGFWSWKWTKIIAKSMEKRLKKSFQKWVEAINPKVDAIFDTVMNYCGTQNQFEMELKIDLELRFHDFEWSWTQLFLYFWVIFLWFWVVLGSNFGAFGSLEGVWALPGAPWGPLGGQGAPNMGPGSEKLVRWTPPGLPKWGHFCIDFRCFS